MKKELVIVLDFGGQYNQLVARRVRECNVYCEIYSYKTDIEKIKEMNPKGIILTGGPNSCYEPDSPTYSEELFKLGIPVLGLCYGAQLMSHVLGGKVERADVREYGKTEVIIDKKDSKVFEGVSETTTCWMSHFDYISKIAPGFEITAHTADCPVAAAENAAEKLYAIQFHPEVLHTVEGTKMINNFVKNVCECAGDWKMDAFVENTIAEIREKVGNGRVLLALSGGVDSSVAAGLLIAAFFTGMIYTKQELYAQEETQKHLAQEVFRFHVLANSDSEKDQNLKLQVRDAVLDYMKEELSEEPEEKQCLKQTVQWARTHTDEIRAIGEKTVAMAGEDQSVNVAVTTCYFPDRTYGDVTFPAGNYQALRVELGNAEGHNWWCVLYPNLCFLDTTNAVVPDKGKKQLKQVLTEEEYSKVTANTKFKIGWYFWK